MWSALTDEAVLQARLGELGGTKAALLEYERAPEDVRFVLRQGIDANQLPSVARALINGDLEVRREQTWSPSDAGYTGVAKASVNGVPGEIFARTKLAQSGDLVLLSTLGEVKVRIPFLGGKLEQVIAEQVSTLLELEAVFTQKWLAGTRPTS